MMAREAAEFYIDRGMHPIPIPFRGKACLIDNWPSLIVTKANLPQYFNGAPSNIGVIVGDDYRTADVDLDCSEAIVAAPELLPETAMVFKAVKNCCGAIRDPAFGLYERVSAARASQRVGLGSGAPQKFSRASSAHVA
jgi:hypothetical protein